jgi:hypothetical protein
LQKQMLASVEKLRGLDRVAADQWAQVQPSL